MWTLKSFSLVTYLLLCLAANKLYGQNFTVIDTLPDGAYGTAAWGDFDNDGYKDLAYLTQALPNVTSGNYGGDHWLASFALYALGL